MPTELCWRCKEVKPGVKLCAEDRLCPQCDEENELALAAIRAAADASNSETETIPCPPEVVNDPDNVSKQGRPTRGKSTAIKKPTINAVGNNKSGLNKQSPAVDKAAQHSSPAVSKQTTSANNTPKAASASTCKAHRIIVINELLSYVAHYRTTRQYEVLRNIVLYSFAPPLISEAKQKLINCYSQTQYLKSCSFTGDRRNSSTRSAHEADLDDIFGIFNTLEQCDGLKSVSFAAVNLDLIPRNSVIASSDDRSSFADVVQKQSESLSATVVSNIKHYVDSQVRSFDELTQTVDRLQQSVESFTKLHSNNTSDSECNNESPIVVTQSVSHPKISNKQYDRSGNIIIFGIEENRNPEIWRQKVDEVLSYLLKRPVDISDMFRLGKYCDSKVRPILVKLKVAWDKRLILSKRSELKNSHLVGVFIAADEPIEMRRKETFNRLKYKAELSGKSVVVVNDDVLHIDNVPTYSLSQGKISSSSSHVQDNNNGGEKNTNSINNEGENYEPGSTTAHEGGSVPNNPQGRPSSK